jgi:hypothetical protein
MCIFFYFQFRVRVKLHEESEFWTENFEKSSFLGSNRPEIFVVLTMVHLVHFYVGPHFKGF